MKITNLRRKVVLVGMAGAAVGAMALGATPAQAATPTPIGSQVGHLTLTPSSGDMNAKPTWTTDVGCPTGFQTTAIAQVVIDPVGPVTSNVSVLVPVSGSTPPSGSFQDPWGTVVLNAGLQNGHTYEVVIRCLSDQLTKQFVQSTFVKIADDGNSWQVVPPSQGGTAVTTSTTVVADPSTAAQGDSVNLTATVTAQDAAGNDAVGQVEFFNGADSLGTAAVSGGTASKMVSTLPVGDDSITAKFEPTDPAAFAGSMSSPTTVTITSSGGGGANTETINLNVPQGAEGVFTFTVDPTAVTMTQAASNGTALASTGSLSPVTVSDGRTTSKPGWSLSGQIGDFTSGADTIDGNDLGWTPKITTANADNDVTAGALITAQTNPGLKQGGALASAAAAKGLGTTTLGADLSLLAPVDTAAGNYSATLTLTAIEAATP